VGVQTFPNAQSGHDHFLNVKNEGNEARSNAIDHSHQITSEMNGNEFSLHSSTSQSQEEDTAEETGVGHQTVQQQQLYNQNDIQEQDEPENDEEEEEDEEYVDHPDNISHPVGQTQEPTSSGGAWNRPSNEEANYPLQHSAVNPDPPIPYTPPAPKSFADVVKRLAGDSAPTAPPTTHATAGRRGSSRSSGTRGGGGSGGGGRRGAQRGDDPHAAADPAPSASAPPKAPQPLSAFVTPIGDDCTTEDLLEVCYGLVRRTLGCNCHMSSCI